MGISPFVYAYQILKIFLVSAVLPAGILAAGLFLNALYTAIATRRGKATVRHPRLLLFGIIALLGLPLGAAFQGSFMYFLLAAFGVFYFLIPGFLVLAVLAVVSRLRGSQRRTPATLAVAGAGCLLALVLGLGSGWAMCRWEISAARDYVARVVPTLEAIKARVGSYPDKLPVAQIGSPPTLLKWEEAYSSDGKTFTFRYVNPAGDMDGFEYSSTTHAWQDY